MTTTPEPTEYCRCQQPAHYQHLPRTAPDWLIQARAHHREALTALLAVEANHKDPLRRDRHGDARTPEQLRPDEVARFGYFDASDRLRLARALRLLASVADWDTVVEVEEATMRERLEETRRLEQLRKEDAT